MLPSKIHLRDTRDKLQGDQLPKMAGNRERILIVDDDGSTRKSLALVFEKHGYKVETAQAGQKALEKTRESFFNLVLLDLNLPDMAGIDLVEPLKEMRPDIVVIMATAYASLETAVQALHKGASAYITKPLNIDEVLATIREALEKQRLVKEKKEAEEQLQHYAAQLERSNQELEEFAYMVAHDLQEPLRMVGGYVQLLAQAYQGKLDSNADDFIKYAVDGVARMQALINGMLEYARVDTQGQALEPTDAEIVLDRAITNLQMAIQESNGQITRDPLPTVMADPTQLTQVFQNLLSNGIKFRGKEPPHIHVSARQDGSEWTFSVQDNGIGIEPKYINHLFQMLQHLHPKGKYPGSGIGLAICKKIVERHRGRIWAESELGKGATFYFTVPSKQ
jgi:signal transduction histidine kinase